MSPSNLYEKSSGNMGLGDEKHQKMVSSSRRKSAISIAILLACSLYLLSNYLLPSSASNRWSMPTEYMQIPSQMEETPLLAIENELIPLEAHIMSKCPDAKDCLKDLVVPAMQKVWNKVNFTLSYIGQPTANDGVDCMHGATECLGNILELCAARLYPSPINYLGFTMCLTETYRDIPQRYLVEGCALEYGLDFEALNTCASDDDGALGMGMLRESIERSSSVGVTKSCTVRLNEEIYCIRDGGEWKDCPQGPGVNDLVLAVEKLYRSN